MGKTNLIAFLLCLFVVLPLKAEKWSAQTLPMPYLQNEHKHVCNPDGVLSAAAEDSINARLYALEHDKGVQAIFVVVNNLEGDDPYAFGMELGRKYGIGSKQNTGLIVILASKDRSYQILTGNGLEGTLPDAICRRIENRVMVPSLREGNWDKAMTETAVNIDKYIRKDSSLTLDEDNDDDADGLVLAGLVIAVVSFFAFFSFFNVQKRKRCPKCGYKPMRTISRKRVHGITTGSWRIKVERQCPKCGYCSTDYEDDNSSGTGTGGMFPPFIMGSGGHSSGGSFGGSFGGGSFGGGGSGGRF